MSTNNNGAADSRSAAVRKGVTAVLFSFAALAAAKAVQLAINSDSIGAQYIAVLVRGVIAFIPFVFLGGMKWLDLKNNSIRKTFKFGRPLLIFNIIFASLQALITLREGIKEGALLRILLIIPLALLVGINEEVVCRGLMCEGMHAIFGKKKNHALHAALLSSFVFGFMHVITSLDFSNIYGVLTPLLKTAETMMFGIIFCYCCIVYKDITGVIVLHAVFDGVVFAANMLKGTKLAGEYTTTDEKQGIVKIGAYILMILVFLPRTIKASKRLADCELTDGLFGDGGDAVTDPDESAAAAKAQPA